MKTLTVKVEIQFDQLSDSNSTDYAAETLDKMTEVLQNHFEGISPVIFTSGIDSSDIKISEEEIEDWIED